jgi:lysozyme
MVTDTLLSLVKQFEGCRLKAYPDPVTGGEPITIGFGATGVDALGCPITLDTVWTMQEALDDLSRRLEALQTRIKGFLEVELNQNQLDALTCLAYNIGAYALETSFVVKCCNAGNFDAVPGAILKWSHAGGKEVPGLLRRRQAEAALFSKE